MYLLTGPTYYIIHTEIMIPGTKTITQLKVLIKGTSILLQKSDSRSRRTLLCHQARETLGWWKQRNCQVVREKDRDW
jgi:hypothetical protein